MGEGVGAVLLVIDDEGEGAEGLEKAGTGVGDEPLTGSDCEIEDDFGVAFPKSKDASDPKLNG